MSDDLKLGIDITADLSKLDSSLQRAEQKVAASGQKMQRSIALTPGSGAGAMTTGGGSLSMAAPHPNNVTFASLNAAGGGGLGTFGGVNYAAFGNIANTTNHGTAAFGGIGVNPGLPNSHNYAAFGNMANTSVNHGTAAFAGIGVNPGLPNSYNYAAFGDIANTTENYGTAAFAGIGVKGPGMFSRGMSALSGSLNMAGFLRGTAFLGTAMGAANLGGTILDIHRDRGFGGGAGTSARNAAFFGAQVESDQSNIPLIGGTMTAFNRRMSGVNYEATSGAIESASTLARANSAGLFGGGLAGKGRLLEADRGLFADEVERMKQSRAAPYAIASYELAKGRELDLRQNELGIETTQRHLDASSQVAQLGARSRGLGLFADIMGINREADRDTAFAASDTQQRRDDINNLRKAKIGAAMMSGLSPGVEVSQFGSAAALGGDAVRIGSSGGQSDEIVKYMKDIADNTEDRAAPRVGRN